MILRSTLLCMVDFSKLECALQAAFTVVGAAWSPTCRRLMPCVMNWRYLGARDNVRMFEAHSLAAGPLEREPKNKRRCFSRKPDGIPCRRFGSISFHRPGCMYAVTSHPLLPYMPVFSLYDKGPSMGIRVITTILPCWNSPLLLSPHSPLLYSVVVVVSPHLSSLLLQNKNKKMPGLNLPSAHVLSGVFASPISSPRGQREQPLPVFPASRMYPYASITEGAKDKAHKLSAEAQAEFEKASKAAQKKTGHIELYSAKYYAACTMGGLFACVSYSPVPSLARPGGVAIPLTQPIRASPTRP